MRRALLVLGLTVGLTSSAMAACRCIRYKERVAIDNYAVRHGHFYVTSCRWHGGRYDTLVCRARRPTECYFAQPNSAGEDGGLRPTEKIREVVPAALRSATSRDEREGHHVLWPDGTEVALVEGRDHV